jgi:dedicated sortase system histidine kinase
VIPFAPTLSIRAKVLLVAAVLLTIPWLGYRYVVEMEKFLREGQERAVAGLARAVATALHDRPRLFLTGPVGEKSPAGLMVTNLTAAMRLDGQASDWERQVVPLHQRSLGELSAAPGGLVFYSLSIDLRAGRFGRHLYLFVRATDDRVVRPAGRGDDLGRADHLLLVMEGVAGELRRWRLTGDRGGQLRAEGEQPGGRWVADPGVEGVWLWSETGYTAELRLPFDLGSERVRLLAVDVDTGRGARAGESPVEVASLAFSDTEIDLIIKGLARSSSRIWVLDTARRVLAQAGSLQPPAPSASEDATGLGARLREHLLRPLYALLLQQPGGTQTEDWLAEGGLEGPEVEAALSGIATTGWRHLPDERAAVVSAAHPVWNEDRVMGVVLVEESTRPILSVRNAALEALFNLTLAVFILGALALFVFARHVSVRIRRLRDAVDRAIDPQGRVRGEIETPASGDEIGDLARSFVAMLARLRQYTGYLEQMASRLSHEFRTPIAVVRSSLENLKGQSLPAEAQVYLHRAEQGLARLSTLLTRMTEATRLEQALARAERERFDLAQVVSGCVEGYRSAYPGRELTFYLGASGPMGLMGVPDLIAQLLDKLVANAMDFARPGTPVTVRLEQEGNQALLRVLNEGPPLPAEMQGRLFESMVSVRPNTKESGEPHLGLGLYIVRLIAEFHGGAATLANRQDVDGVVATVRLPLA